MEAYECCPRFEKCCINKCILHPDYKKLQSVDSDPEQKCTLPKSIRKRLGASLSWGGLKESEIKGQKRWDSLPDEVKLARIAKLKKTSLINRLSEKGYSISPKSSVISETHIKKAQDGANSSIETCMSAAAGQEQKA